MSAQETVEKYRTAHAAVDYEAMAACWADGYVFNDPAFPEGTLDAKSSKGMWRMFIDNKETNKMQVTHKPATCTAENVWEYDYVVNYVFNGRPVENHIHARLTLDPTTHLIERQEDRFDFYGWSKQSLGLMGYILGWSEVVQGKVRTEAKKKVDAYTTKVQSSL